MLNFLVQERQLNFFKCNWPIVDYAVQYKSSWKIAIPFSTREMAT